MRPVAVLSVVVFAVASVSFVFRSGAAVSEKLVLRFANADADYWLHCLSQSCYIRCSSLKTFLQWDIEHPPVDG
jgi:hypothetical protein